MGLLSMLWAKAKMERLRKRGLSMDPDYDYCYECSGYGDDYYLNDDGELVCRCPECPNNREDGD